MSDEDKKEFTVKDRRFFSQDSSEVDQTQGQSASAAPQPAQPDGGQGENQTDGGAGQEDQTATPLPEINFATFVMSLNASALVHLGLIEDPSSGTKIRNLPMAKQTIDILSMLQTKTQGNLDKDEENILKTMLYDLKMMYVKQKE